MKTSAKHLEEIPNLSYVRKLAKTDIDFQQRFITALKEEYASDSLAYLYHMEIDQPRAASAILNKLKYTLSFLSMNEAFEFTELHQEKLRTADTSLHAQFKKIMVTVHKFLRNH